MFSWWNSTAAEFLWRSSADGLTQGARHVYKDSVLFSPKTHTTLMPIICPGDIYDCPRTFQFHYQLGESPNIDLRPCLNLTELNTIHH